MTARSRPPVGSRQTVGGWGLTPGLRDARPDLSAPPRQERPRMVLRGIGRQKARQ